MTHASIAYGAWPSKSYAGPTSTPPFVSSNAALPGIAPGLPSDKLSLYVPSCAPRSSFAVVPDVSSKRQYESGASESTMSRYVGPASTGGGGGGGGMLVSNPASCGTSASGVASGFASL